MTSRRKRRQKDETGAPVGPETHVHPNVAEQEILIRLAARLERGEPLEAVLKDAPERLRPAIESSIRTRLTPAEVAEKLCIHFKIGSVIIGGEAVFTMMVFRDATEDELVASLMIPSDRVMEFAEIADTAAKAFSANDLH